MRTLLTCILLFCVGLEAGAKVYVVAAGISDYPGRKNDLMLAAADARTIVAMYKANDNADCRLLLDRNATKSAILKAIRAQFSKAGPDDIVVFFFSGHGVKGAFCAYDGMLDYSAVRKAMAASKSKNKMIFADACFSGKFRESKNASKHSAAAKKANVMLFLSSRSNEYSIERPGMSNGFFTTYLVNGLAGGADSNRDRTITARELFNFVSKGVSTATSDLQHPVMWGKFADTMPVMSW